MSVRARGCRGREMGTAAATKGVRGARATPWAAALEKGVEGWSSFTETGSGEDIRTEDGSREVVDSARVRAGAAAASAGAPAADGPVAARSGGDGKSADAKSGGGTGAAAASGADGKAPSGGGDATVAAKRDAKDPNNPAAHKRPALDQGWRLYRRDVEWQCRWLELRMVEIDGHVDRYQRMLDGIERAKRMDGVEAAEKTTTTSGEPETTALTDGVATRMKRRRQHQGDTPPPNPVLGTHPLLVADDDAMFGFGTAQTTDQKPEKLTAAQRKRRKKEAAAQAALADKLANKSGSGTGSDSDLSTAALYEQIEVLQQRVTALHARLGQPAPELNGTGSVVAIRNNRGAAMGAFGGFAREPPKPPVEKLKSRRDDFDINNVVGANEGAKFVERAQHVDICTPGVRPAPTYAMAPINDQRGSARAEKAKAQAEAAAAAAIVAGEGGNAAAVAEARTAGLPDGALDDDDCLSEDTSDEAYVHRHAHLEVAERKARTLPDKRDKRDKDKNAGGGHGGATGAARADDADSGDGSNKRRKGGGSGSASPPTPPAVLAEPAVVAEDDGEPELNSAALVG